MRPPGESAWQPTDSGHFRVWQQIFPYVDVQCSMATLFIADLGTLCAVHAVADMLTDVCLNYLRLDGHFYAVVDLLTVASILIEVSV